MKIFKSKGGYFYKVYKNRKKKRISKRKYFKIKNKTNNKYNFKEGGGQCCSKPASQPNNTSSIIYYIENDLNNSLELICEILIQSHFYQNIMKPLLLIKRVQIKQLGNSIKFGGLDEPFFHHLYYKLNNFQDKLFEWWKNISNDFNEISMNYTFLNSSPEELKDLILKGPEENFCYFDLQLPVVFINRIIQMLQFYLDIFNEKNSNTFLIVKKNIKKLNKIDNFQIFLQKLDFLYSHNFQYKYLLDTEIAYLDWHEKTVKMRKNISNSYLETKLEFFRNSSTALEDSFNDSLTRKYCHLPISIAPNESKYLQTLCIPVTFYLGKHKLVHENDTLNIAHVKLQFIHDLRHCELQIIDYQLLSDSNVTLIDTTFRFRKLFIQLILEKENDNLTQFVFCFLHETNIGKFFYTIALNLHKYPIYNYLIEKCYNHKKFMDRHFLFAMFKFIINQNLNDIEPRNEISGINIYFYPEEPLPDEILVYFKKYSNLVCECLENASLEVYGKSLEDDEFYKCLQTYNLNTIQSYYNTQNSI